MARRLFVVLASIFLILSQALGAAAAGIHAGPAPQQAAAPIASGLIDELRAGTRSGFVVEFAATADLRGARAIPEKAGKGSFVYDQLTKTAAASQSKALKEARGVGGIKATSYWLTNVLIVQADAPRGHQPDRVVAARLANLAEKLAKTSGVTGVRAEKVMPLVKPVKNTAGAGAGILAVEPEWGIEKIGAPDVWAQGITGSGIVVGAIDTGVEYTHEALVEHYRGNLGGGTFDHNYNWWDPSGVCPEAAPCDNVFHGTHTMGTIVGGDLDGPLPDIGVAPGAEWIAAKGCEDLGCSEFALLESGEFMLAPTDLNGDNPDTSKAPDLVSNSWGNDNPDDQFYLEIVQAWRAAGIIPVFAAGNAGPGCSTAGTPGNYNEAISAGATDIDDNIAIFSSRGPSPTGKISPNLSAPGVDVRSSVPGNGYAEVSGTSMATPHLAGAIALMMSSELALIGDFDAILNALNATAIDRPDDQCGSPDPDDLDPNFVYGEGRIDAQAAVDLVKNGGTLVGTVTDDATSDPIAGARVTADNGDRQFSTTTGGDGAYDLFLPAGTYTVSASAFGYQTAAVFGTLIETDLPTTENFALTALPRFTVSGTVSSSGSPIEGASVVALGTPVAPATTDPAGDYAIELPIGDYTLRAMLGGCTESALADISSTGDDVVQDFTLVRKTDNYGHACRPIAFDWVDAGGQTALFGDDSAGYLRMSFDFPFYGEAYSRFFVSTNGFINFLEPDATFFPSGIPSTFTPNAAIYALWQDLVIDEDASIDYATIGSGDDAAFVLEYSNVLIIGTDLRLTFEMKLWANGTIDFLYGDNPSDGDGRNATIGIENATGTDALQLGFFESVLEPNSAIRIETLPFAILTGTVSDVNDGLGIGGATLTADPSGRTASTDSDGHYELRLPAGSYDITASKANYEPVTLSVTLSEGETANLDFALAASTATVEPTAFEETLEFGETVDRTVTLSNGGGATLTWEAKERVLGTVPPDLPPAVAGAFRTPNWQPPHVPSGMPLAQTRPFDASSAPIIIDDPDDDSFDSNELLAVRGQSSSDQMEMALEFAPSMPIGELAGFIHFDVDQDPGTGLPPEALFGLPTQDIGFDYFADLFEVAFGGFVPVFDLQGNLVAEVPATVDGATVSFAVPLAAFGDDDGNIDVTMVVGFFGPSDWAPDEGHGTVQAFADASWLSEAPESGEIPSGSSEDITITIGGPTVAPGDYQGQVVFVTNAPKGGQPVVDVMLHVILPEAFGAAAGTITDAHTGAPIGDASVALHATWLGNPLDFVTTTAGDGTWSIVGPEGTWPVDVTADGYVGASLNATIVRGVTTGGADAALHLAQPHALVEGGPFTFILTEGTTDHGTVVVSNPGGHADLTFTIAEIDQGGPAATGSGAWLHAPSASGTTRANSATGTTAAPSSFRWLANPGDTPSVLIYADDFIHTAPNTLVDQAVQRLGISYVAHYDGDFAGFQDDLASGTWDVVVFADDNFFPPTSVLDDLNAYVEGGGKLAYHSWTVFDSPGHPLFSTLGIQFVDNDFDPPDPVFWWDPTHPAFTIPESVPELTSLDSGIYGIYGQRVDASGGAETLAGYTTPGPDDGQGALVLGNESRSIFKGFMDGQNSADLDKDGVLDGAELWENLVIGLQTGFVSDAPWLTITPIEGVVQPDGSMELDVAVDTTGLVSGVYQARVLVRTNDPDHRSTSVPVTLVVSKYQQGINAGGGEYTRGDGVTFSADRAYASGAFGWVGPSSIRSTGAPIDGTDDDALYRNARVGMTAYRFDVPDGVYRVDLAFAELQVRHPGDRVFSVLLEGGAVLSNFDIYELSGGQRIALDRSFLVEVTDGVLDVSFLAQRGDEPLISAILVTELPEGAQGG